MPSNCSVCCAVLGDKDWAARGAILPEKVLFLWPERPLAPVGERPQAFTSVALITENVASSWRVDYTQPLRKFHSPQCSV